MSIEHYSYFYIDFYNIYLFVYQLNQELGLTGILPGQAKKLDALSYQLKDNRQVFCNKTRKKI